jgi:hypothetical protein
MLRLAAHLHMTARELGERMDSQEFSEWIAFDRYYSPLPDPWRETSLVATSILAPHCKEKIKPDAFVPVENPPQHASQDLAALLELRRQLGMVE